MPPYVFVAFSPVRAGLPPRAASIPMTAVSRPTRTAAGLWIVLPLALSAAGPAAADPAATAWVDGEAWRTRIVSAVTATGSRPVLPLALEVELDDGWHIYWRSPGEAGMPPSLAVAPGSANVKAADLDWPAPRQSIEQGQLVTRTYAGHVVIPVRLQVEQPGWPVTLAARLDYQVCARVCIPVQVDARLEVPAGAAEPSAHARTVAEAEARVPGRPEAAGWQRLRASFDGARTIRVTAERLFPLDPVPEADILALVEGPDGVFFRSGPAAVSADGRTATVEVEVLPPFDPEQLAGSEVGVTLIAGSANAHQRLGLNDRAAGSDAGVTLSAALLLALLGGLILNLMPCVLPVLGIKAARLIDAAGRDRRGVTASFLATSTGIVASFGALALLVIAIRAAGLRVGWGFQFQNPGFVAFLAVVVVLFAAVLAGICHIRLPAAASRWLQTAGAGARGRVGAFCEGALATLLATPCTAPVVGTTVGFALTRGPVEIGFVFLALGLGMAAPWLLIAARPGLLAALPRPGPWMRRLKQVFALMLLGTGVWLLSVLQAGAGTVPAVAAAALSGAAVLAFAVRAAEPLAPALRAAGVAAVGLAVLVPTLTVRTAADSADPDRLWLPLDPAAVREQAAGQVVLVDVTAAWCVTCIVNKRLVLDRSPVRDLLEAGEIVGFRGDWTRPDPAIAAYLAAHQRLGVPFNAVYGPARAEGEVLPEILTPEAVTAAVARAKRAPLR